MEEDQLRSRRGLIALGIAAVVAVVSGCSGGGTGADKAGGQGAPIILRMADGYEPGLELEPAVADFVRRVRGLSDGQIRIKVVDHWAANRPGFEQQIVRDVAAGKADVAWVGTRIFDTLGVRSFQALTAPLLIDSYELERAVIASDIPAKMLPGLDKLGVTGVGVLGNGLRKPIAQKRPLLRPADWRGIRFAAFRSRGQAAAIHALGARTTDMWGPMLQDAVASGRVDGFEKHYFLWSLVIDPSVVPYVAANVNLWPETVALIANPDRLSKLSRPQQAWLREAATEAAAHSTSLFENERPLIANLCKQGARFSNASPADLVAMRRVFEPVYAALQRDALTKEFIHEIEGMKRTTTSEPAASIPPSCAGPRRPRAAPVARTTDPRVLNGIYRVTWTDEELAAAAPMATYSRPSYGGIITLSLSDGRYRFRPGTPPQCTGTYTVAADRVRFRVAPGSYCQGVLTARWSLHNGQLRLHIIAATDPGDPLIWGGKPWKRIG